MLIKASFLIRNFVKAKKHTNETSNQNLILFDTLFFIPVYNFIITHTWRNAKG